MLLLLVRIRRQRLFIGAQRLFHVGDAVAARVQKADELAQTPPITQLSRQIYSRQRGGGNTVLLVTCGGAEVGNSVQERFERGFLVNEIGTHDHVYGAKTIGGSDTPVQQNRKMPDGKQVNPERRIYG